MNIDPVVLSAWNGLHIKTLTVSEFLNSQEEEQEDKQTLSKFLRSAGVGL